MWRKNRKKKKEKKGNGIYFGFYYFFYVVKLASLTCFNSLLFPPSTWFGAKLIILLRFFTFEESNIFVQYGNRDVLFSNFFFLLLGATSTYFWFYCFSFIFAMRSGLCVWLGHNLTKRYRSLKWRFDQQMMAIEIHWDFYMHNKTSRSTLKKKICMNCVRDTEIFLRNRQMFNHLGH